MAREDAYRSAGVALVVREKSRRLDGLAAKVSNALESAFIRCLLLRGPVLARWLYIDASDRPYEDVDLLVPVHEHARAAKVLTGLGLRSVLGDASPSEQAPHAETFEGAEGDVDLHWTLRGIGASPEAAWGALNRGREEMELGQTAVQMPGPAARALTVALHAAQHGPQGPTQLGDIERAVSGLPRSTWEQAITIADELDAFPAFAAGIGLAPGGERLLGELGISAELNLDLAVRREGNVPVIRGIARLRETSGVAARGRLLARELVPSRTFMREWSAVARRGGVGLAAAYAIRPFWLAWRLPPAYAAYRRARRAAR
ncbi:MAG: nucleotidyltransferase family protein [Chloroflexota bacterium]|nr:nucleotidyltransferase family protein [Chloroflexota bacterium]